MPSKKRLKETILEVLAESQHLARPVQLHDPEEQSWTAVAANVRSRFEVSPGLDRILEVGKVRPAKGGATHLIRDSAGTWCGWQWQQLPCRAVPADASVTCGLCIRASRTGRRGEANF